MAPPNPLTIQAALVCVLLLGGLGVDVGSCTEPLFVGTAKLELTPPGKVPLAGYSRRRGKASLGVHDPVFVRALVIQQGETTVALASCDLLIIDERLFDAVKQRVETARGNPPLHLLIAATHTHSGPGAYGQKFFEKLSMGHFDAEVFELLSTRIAQAILTASTQLQPATVSYASVPTHGLVVNRMDPGGVVDPTLVVVGFHGTRRQPLAAIVNFSAHPTTLGAWNMQLSADYPGVVMQLIERRFPGVLCLFLAGAVADQGPVKHGEKFEPAERFGRTLADQVTPLLERPSDDRDGLLGFAEQTVALPPARVRLGAVRLPTWISRLLVDDDATISVVTMGTPLLVGLPCDVSAELGQELTRAARERGYDPVIVGFANDYIGYCLPEHLYGTDSYEASMAFNGPKTGEMLVEELKQMIDELGQGAGDGGQGK